MRVGGQRIAAGRNAELCRQPAGLWLGRTEASVMGWSRWTSAPPPLGHARPVLEPLLRSRGCSPRWLGRSFATRSAPASSSSYARKSAVPSSSFASSARPVGSVSGGGAPFVSSHFSISEDEITHFFSRKSLVWKRSGEELVVQTCPTCPDHKYKMDNLFKLYISKRTGQFFCHRCGNKGSWFDFKRLYGEIPYTAPMSAPVPASGEVAHDHQHHQHAPAPGLQEEREKPLPDHDVVSKYPLALFNEYPQVLTFLTGNKTKVQRHLSEEVIRKYKVGATKYAFGGDSEQCVTFPWIDADAEGRNSIRRLKIRSIKNKANQRLTPAGGQWGFFGWHTVPADAKEIVITEGEFDAMAVYQATGLPAISLPNGAHSLPVELLPRLERFEKIYLWMDDDIPGQEGAAKFAQKLGIKRCLLVRTKQGDPEGPKDANDALRAGKDLNAILKKAGRTPHQQVISFQDIADEVYRNICSPDELAGVPSKMFPSLTKILKGHRKGELTVFTGPTGVGKTTLLSQLSLDFAMQGVRTLWGNFEIKNTYLAQKMLLQYAGKNLAELQDRAQWDEASRAFSDLPLYWMRFHGSTSVDQVLDAMDYAVYVHDVEHVVLDNLQFMLSGQAWGQEGVAAGNKFDIQDRALEEFRRFASTKNVHITLVIHPRKTEDDRPLNVASVFGSVKATQEADNVLILQYNKGEDWKWLEVAKNRFDGELGPIALQFNKRNKSYREMPTTGLLNKARKGASKGASNQPDDPQPATASSATSTTPPTKAG
uniref:Mitochondrial helicase twinkle n=1 Tax=Acanthamoeba castellanii TaxID=5755 RepID=Q1L7I7_ACACA|nr:mitochondrial helicase twinkle [Acanthamoeba castellanii]